MEYINIVLSADDNYAQHVAVVMASIATNTAFKNIRVFLLSDGISVDKKEKLNITAANHKIILEVIEMQNKKEFAAFYTSGHISKAAYFRLAIPRILPASVKKVIYLDVDLLVLDDIQELWEFDIKNHPVAAVADYGIMASGRMMKQKKEVIGITDNACYFNSGVMVINVEAWRKNNYSEKVIDLASKKSFPHHDQDVLNKVFINNWMEIPLKWNVIPPVFNLLWKILFKSRFRTNAIKAKKQPAIFHYAGRYKPWEFYLNYGFNERYYEYLAATEFSNEKMPQPSKNMKGKSINRQLIRLKIAEIWMKVLG